MLGEEVVRARGVSVEEERGIGRGCARGSARRGKGKHLGFGPGLGSGFVLWLCDFGGHWSGDGVVREVLEKRM